MILLQQRTAAGARQVVAKIEEEHRVVHGFATTRELAQAAIEAGKTLAEAVSDAELGEAVDVEAELAAGRLLPAIDHSDPAHLFLTGTGLTHLGSAEGRDRMHKAAASGDATDSMRMFLEGLEGGKPADGAVGQQPEWFYKGSGHNLVGTEGALDRPSYAKDGGEEPEIAGIYLIGPDGTPHRLGFCLANEYSDHVTEKHNYLWLAHSKLRQASLGAELLTGALPQDIRGTARIVRNDATLWEKPFLTGEANMAHTVANLEHHHFKYAVFRQPGDVHVHFFGTSTASFADDIQTREDDRFEISAPPFALPLRNTLRVDEAAETPVRVAAL
ncbi:AraD1 family protein [Qipengyuania atrilutea]|uniref:FAH family protein n=1 Tax=Qipengyuania atrilutea TaxID=2744473 RepID=A0A850GZL9_9SPHN|nr:AraD1 family protein [Actirhodobacter atriluteus]NVD45081.1 FAH family protein [Actirhodobacter atriluteus]